MFKAGIIPRQYAFHGADRMQLAWDLGGSMNPVWLRGSLMCNSDALNDLFTRIIRLIQIGVTKSGNSAHRICDPRTHLIPWYQSDKSFSHCAYSTCAPLTNRGEKGRGEVVPHLCKGTLFIKSIAKLPRDQWAAASSKHNEDNMPCDAVRGTFRSAPRS